jgi:hypothetical protein
MTLAVVRVARRATGAQRKGQLRAFQRLNRRLLVDAQHHGMLGRVEVQPDDIGYLRGELRIAADLVRPNQVRFEAVLSQDV